MIVRIAVAVVVATMPFVAGCGSSDKPTPSTTTPAASDEDQIRDVIKQEGDAAADWDGAKLAELTCAQNRDEASSFEGLAPPMSAWQVPGIETVTPEALAEQITVGFPGASDESALTVAKAVLANDEDAYQTSMTEVMKQTSTIEFGAVDNVKVDGDSATADVAITFTTAGQDPQTDTTTITLIREDGKWLDCTPTDEE
jgi:hypothetical protein